MKVLFLTNIPSPYRVDFFNELGKYCKLTVVYERGRSNERDKRWRADAAVHYRQIMLRGVSVRKDSSFCPSVITVLRKKWDRIILGDYASATSMFAIEWLRIYKKPFVISADGGFIKDDGLFRYHLKRHFISAASWWLSSGCKTTDYLVHYGAKRDNCYLYPFTSVRDCDLKEAFRGKAACKLAEGQKVSFPQREAGNCEILKSWKDIRNRERECSRCRLGIHERKVILTVGRFIPQKGMDTLLKATECFEPCMGVYVVGGIPTKEYERLAKRSGAKVHFVDFLLKDQLQDYYKAADVFAFPTRGDAWGLVINEAMSFGLPVVATDRCLAALEMVKEGVNGSIVPVDGVEELRHAVEYWIDGDHSQEGGLESYRTVQSYTIEKMAHAHMQALRKMKS